MRLRGYLTVFAAWLLAAVGIAQLPAEDAIAQREAISRLQGRSADVRLFRDGTTIHRVYGAAFAGGITAKDAFLAFIAEYSELFGIGDGKLVFEGTQDVMRGKFTAGYFQQYLEGIPVDLGYVTLLARNDIGNPIVLASPSAQFVRGPAPKPRITAQHAVRILKKHHPSYVTFSKPELRIWKGEARAHLAWSFYAENPNPVGGDHEGPLPERVLAFVDAVDGAVLEERNQVYPIDVGGNVKGWATPGLKPDQANNPETLQPLELLRVSISGGNNALTNASGDYLIPHPGSTAVTVNASLQGQWVVVNNQGGTNLTMSQVVTPPGPANFIFNVAMPEFDTAQVNGFIQTTRVHNFAKAINPAYPGIDIAIPCNVNVSGSCNAFYTNNTINFYRAGGNCPNMCYSTVVWHEYGHFIIAKGHPSAAGDYHEGMADVTANLLGDTPWVGEDFSGQNTGPLRSAYNSIRYPCTGGVHTCGQVMSGAFWLTLDQLDITEGHVVGLGLVRSWYLNSILLRPPSVNPGITIDVLTLDDDDANLNNGTPHYDEIATGFGAKGLTAPPLVWVNIAPVRLPDAFVPLNPTGEAIPFEARVTNGAGTLDPSSVRLNYRFNGGAWQQLPMPEVADPDIYGALLLQPACGTTVDWYISARDTNNRMTTYPSGAPGSFFSTLVARSLTTIFTDTFETDTGWTVTNVNLTTGAWVRVDPNGTFLNGVPAQPENDSNDPGLLCYVTGQGTPGGAVGAQDVDGGPTYLTSPVINLAGADALIEYRRWYFNDDGDDPFLVQVSNNNGATWVTVETVMGIQNSWVQRTFRVGQYVPPTAQVRVRFSAVDNPNNSITEAGVDNVAVRRINCG